GSPAALYLAAAGVGVLGIVDGDTVDLSNLQRQVIHSTPDLGRPKAVSARESVNALNPEVEVRALEGRLTAANVLEAIAPYDFVLDGTDNFAAKFLINDACVIAGKPFCHAGIIRWKGQLMTWVPGAGPCYRCVFREPPPPEAVPTCREAGVIGALAGVIGCLQAMEAVKFLTGAGELLTGALLTYDALANDFRKVRVPRRAACRVCGDSPDILAPADYGVPACGLPSGAGPGAAR
ncbi:MAG: HesA/MoeB/ThiF family protein, partial [Deltaproteobacteria bacterium]|nr:HesA/MoeB/ThiF family protein [Deltaproteobacteria bacterium]